MADLTIAWALAQFEGLLPTGVHGTGFGVPRDLLWHFVGTGNQSMLNDAWFIPDVCALPCGIWEGLNRPGQERSLCYAGQPTGEFAKENWADAHFQVGRIFTVFLTEDLKVTKWRWCELDPDGSGFPIDHERRFGRRVWPLD